MLFYFEADERADMVPQCPANLFLRAVLRDTITAKADLVAELDIN